MQTRPELLNHILTSLWFLRMSHQDTHWKAQRSYGNHLLFQRLYEAVDTEIDSIAERVIGLEGPEALQRDPTLAMHQRFQALDKSLPLPMQARQAESLFLESLQDAFTSLEAQGALTIGLNDLLASIASQHEIHLYLLEAFRPY